jgi:hypothetical protein
VKLPNWEVELSKFCDSMRSQDLVYGFSDCIMFAAGGVEVQTGVDYTSEHAGKYSDEESARAYMRSRGWSDVDAVVSAYLPAIGVHRRSRGDVLMHIGERGKTLGICLGRTSMVLTLRGAIQIPSSSAKAAWRVGDA